jgi:hypothetical protein
MCDVSLGFFLKGVALRDAIASVSRAVQSSAGGQAPTVLGSPDALPSDFCINPRGGAAGAVAAPTEARTRARERRERRTRSSSLYCGRREWNERWIGWQVMLCIAWRKWRVCDALLVASNADDQVKVAAEGGIAATLGAMQGHPASAEVQEAACGVLWYLAANNADNRVKAKSAGGEDAVKRAMALQDATAETKELGQELLEREIWCVCGCVCVYFVCERDTVCVWLCVCVFI